jgi:hypothetical protein
MSEEETGYALTASGVCWGLVSVTQVYVPHATHATAMGDLPEDERAVSLACGDGRLERRSGVPRRKWIDDRVLLRLGVAAVTRNVTEDNDPA